MKNEKNPLYGTKFQKLINKLIAEETIAHDLYIGSITAVCKCERDNIKDIFIKTADDELNDHRAKLITWAEENDYTVPFKYKDYSKYADEDVIKQLNSLKINEDARYYIAEAIKSEKLAIKSYTDALKTKDLPYDLNALLLHILFDEQEHLVIFEDLLYAYSNGAELLSY